MNKTILDVQMQAVAKQGTPDAKALKTAVVELEALKKSKVRGLVFFNASNSTIPFHKRVDAFPRISTHS